MSVPYLPEKFGGLMWIGRCLLRLHGFVLVSTSSNYGVSEEEDPRDVAD